MVSTWKTKISMRPGAPKRSQKRPGAPKSVQGRKKASKRAQERQKSSSKTSRSVQERWKAPRSAQKRPGTPKSCQDRATPNFQVLNIEKFDAPNGPKRPHLNNLGMIWLQVPFLQFFYASLGRCKRPMRTYDSYEAIWPAGRHFCSATTFAMLYFNAFTSFVRKT